MEEMLTGGALNGERYRVIISTDIGGSDPDDFQSMVHFLLYSDLFDTEGLISSPWGAGRVSDIHTVINAYEKDYSLLKKWSENYPEPAFLRSITKQGALDFAPYKGWSQPTEGSEWLIECARRQDERPLYVLVWGLLEDVAQALHDAPDIAAKLRINYIGGPNKKWGPNAYAYIRNQFPNIWMIEDNSTYRGWFNGGEMRGEWANDDFVTQHIAGRGALGEYFAKQLGGTIKMGDTPTVSWLLKGTPEKPEAASWGGSFARVNNMPEYRHTVEPDCEMVTEAFAITELIFPGPKIEPTEKPVFTLEVRSQLFDGFCTGEGEYKIRFVPKETGRFEFITHSSLKVLDGICGTLTSAGEKTENRNILNGNLTQWWSDIPDVVLAEGPHLGARSVNRWRVEYLLDFSKRITRCISEPQE